MISTAFPIPMQILGQQQSLVFPISNDPSSSKNYKPPISHKQKKLIVLHNFTSLKACACIINEMESTSVDIIIVSNELTCKEKIAEYFSTHLNRGCNTIEVTNLDSISIKQRILYGLLEKDSFIATDSDRAMFTLLSEYSRGAATIVHMLTSLMQRFDDNREGFNFVKDQLNILCQKVTDSQYISQRHHGLILLQNLSMFIKNLLSPPAWGLLNSLSIFGSIPLPLLYVMKLENLITSHANKEKPCNPTSKSPLEELKGNSIIRKCPNPVVYHEYLDGKHVNDDTQLFFIPKLICDAIKNELNYDNRIALIYAQSALESVVTESPNLSFIHVLCNQLRFFVKSNNYLELSHLNQKLM